MNCLAIVGSPRKGKATDSLIDKAIEGLLSVKSEYNINKIYLADKNIEYCRNCLACWKRKTTDSISRCSIRDDMDDINNEILKSDSLIIGTPIHMAYASVLVMTFLERICWTFAKPEKNYIIVKGCPEPRSDKKRKALIITVTGLIPPRYQILCNQATRQIKGVIKDSLNANTVGKLFAGNVWNIGTESYYKAAFKLGKKLV